MKTKKLLLFSMLLMLIAASVVFVGCSKSSSDDSNPTSQAYSNTKDDTTTAILASIPRIELSRVKSTKINLYLSITDQNGRPFGAFNQYNFLIRQVCIGSTDTVTIGSISFQTMNQTGGNIATPLVLDYSGSMSSYIGDLEAAAGKFITIKGKNDQAELIKFSSAVENVQPFTKDTTTLLGKLRETWSGAGNSTALYDAMMLGIDDASTFVGTTSGYLPAVIAFTDGGNNASSSTMQDVIDNALAKQIPIFNLGFGGADPTSLTAIATQTGGRYYYTPDITTLQSLFSMISGQLKNIYLVSWTYSSTGCSDVLIIVQASYTCKKGTFYSRAEKSFQPLK